MDSVKLAGLSGNDTMTARNKIGTRARESPIMSPSIMQVLERRGDKIAKLAHYNVPMFSVPVVEGASALFLDSDNILQSVHHQFMKLSGGKLLAVPLLRAEVFVVQLKSGN